MPVLAPEPPRTRMRFAVERDAFDVEPDLPDGYDFDPPYDDDSDDGDDDGSDGEPLRWVTVATFWHSTRAHIARLKLESEDVDCVLFDENLNWLCATSGGGIKLQVPEPDAARARLILQRYEPELRDAATHDASRRVLDCATAGDALACGNVCPHCGQAPGELLPMMRRMAAVAVPLVVAGLIVPASPILSLLIATASCLTWALPRYRCPQCAGEWSLSGSWRRTAKR